MTRFDIFAARDGDTFRQRIEAADQEEAERKARELIADRFQLKAELQAAIDDDDALAFDAELDGFIVEPDEIVSAEPPAIAAILAAGEQLAAILEDAIETHIYDFGEEPDDCPERQALEDWQRATAGGLLPFGVRFGPAGQQPGTLAAARFTTYGAAEKRAEAIRRANPGFWACVEQLEQEAAATAGEAIELTDAPQGAPIPPPEEDEPEALFRNHYKCAACGHEWQDEWSCACDDDCPSCGARHMSPHTSEELEPAA